MPTTDRCLKMKNRRFMALAGIGLIAVLAGCSKQEATNTNVPPPSPPTPTAGGVKQPGGATPDMNVYPAPAGVKTGLEGGRKGP